MIAVELQGQANFEELEPVDDNEDITDKIDVGILKCRRIRPLITYRGSSFLKMLTSIG